jgi:hypothetical protein
MRKASLRRNKIARVLFIGLAGCLLLHSDGSQAATKDTAKNTPKSTAKKESEVRKSIQAPAANPSDPLGDLVKLLNENTKASNASASAPASANPEPVSLTFEGKLFSNPMSEFNSLPSRVYLDPDFNEALLTPDGERPDITWQECQAKRAGCFELDASAEITRIPGEPPMEKDVLDLAPRGEEDGKPKTMTLSYTKVWVKHKIKGRGGNPDETREGVGWIDSRLLRSRPMRAIFDEPAPKPEPAPAPVAPAPAPAPTAKNPADCPPKLTAQESQSDVAKLAHFFKDKTPTELELLNQAVEEIDPLVGKCRIPSALGSNPKHWSDPQRREALVRSSGKNIYDAAVLPSLMKAKFPNLPKETKDPATGKTQYEVASREDIVAIDTLARTIYSEMNECIKSGLQYPMAVARIALNRLELARTGQAPKNFIGEGHASNKPELSKVLTSPFQFSVWNQNGARNPRDQTILMSLCPAKDESRTNWKGDPPSPEDLQIWRLTLKVATEAVLFPHTFEKRTHGLDGYYYYTSKMSEYDGRALASPSIEGRPVKSYRCMYVWRGR